MSIRRHPSRASLLLVLLAASCGVPDPLPPGIPAVGAVAEPTDIILITIDTLRADHLGCYGYPRDTSPRLDELAAGGILFERAMATMATTLPSHLSLFTGLYPHQHGHLSNKRAVMGPYEPLPGRMLATTLLREAGWRTAAFISAGPLKRSTGMQAGFETWNQPADVWRKGEETVEFMLEWMDDGLTSEPTFLWVHLWDPHEPNDPPPEYRAMFTTDAELEALVDRRAIDHEVLQEIFGKKEIARLFFPELMEPLQRGEDLDVPPLTRKHILDLHNRYDADVRYTDDCLGRIFDALKARGRWGSSFVIVAGDHGQGLGQHDWLLHGRLSGENLHVPLIIKLPDGLGPEGLRVEQVVSLVDVFPTILRRLGGAVAEDLLAQASGDDLLSGSFGRSWAFSQQRTDREREWEHDRRIAITTWPWRFYRVDDGPDGLYDLDTDPGELRNVAAEHPDVVDRLGVLVRRILSHRRATDSNDGEMTEEGRRHLDDLRGLGYVGDDE